MTVNLQTFASFDGTLIAYSVSGDGPPVVLLHGFGATAGSNWKRPGIIDGLVAAGRQVIAPDLRGHGRSAKPHDEKGWPTDCTALDVVALVDHLGLGRYDAVGYSMGSIVLGSVLHHDDRIDNAVLGGMGQRMLDPAWARPKDLARMLLADDPSQHTTQDTSDFLVYVEAIGADRVALGWCQHSLVFRDPAALARVSAPILVLAGVDDDANGDPAALAAILPNATLQRTPGDHGGAIAHPAYRDALVAHLRR